MVRAPSPGDVILPKASPALRLIRILRNGVLAGLAAGWAGSLRAQPATSPPQISVAMARGTVMKVSAPYANQALRLSVGSGVVVAPGLVATNAHVVMESDTIRVEQNGQTWPARLRNLDLLRDIALLEVPGLPLPAATMAETTPAEGGTVFSWSYPGGLGPNLTSGTLGYTWAYRGDRMFQAELEVAKGSSGGGLFDPEGRLLGLTTFVLDSSPHSVFAVPVRWIRELITAPASPLRPGGSRALLLQGFLERMSQDPDNQERWLRFTEVWVRNAPQDPEAWSARAQALQAAQTAMRSGEDLEGLRTRREGEVRDSLEKALALDASRAVDWHNLGVSLDGENRFQESARAFRESLRLRPDYAASWEGLGCTLFNARDFAGAREALVRATELAPDRAVTWSLLGFAEMNTKRWEPAVEHFRIALGLSPFRITWWQAYGQCALRAHDSAAVARAIERLQALDPKAAQELARMAKSQR